MSVQLCDFVEQFAVALSATDARRPSAVSPRSGPYTSPGSGCIRKIDLINLELEAV
jgi:hypothetical protein